MQQDVSPEKTPIRSLREEVYEHLRTLLTQGRLSPGKFLNLNALAKELGTSRTPLRDALLRLESEGFVEILNRRGVRVRELTLDRIRDIYEVVGGLESAALRSVAGKVTPEVVARMGQLTQEAAQALECGDYARGHDANLAFHDAYLSLSTNAKMIRSIHLMKQRLYDFPQRMDPFVEWDQASLAEHREMVRLLEDGRILEAADFLRDVHWSFGHQEEFIRRDYEDRRGSQPSAHKRYQEIPNRSSPR